MELWEDTQIEDNSLQRSTSSHNRHIDDEVNREVKTNGTRQLTQQMKSSSDALIKQIVHVITCSKNKDSLLF